MKYIGTASRMASAIIPRITFGLILDLGLNPEACIRTVEGPLCAPSGACVTERFPRDADIQFVTLRAIACADMTTPFCAVACAPPGALCPLCPPCEAVPAPARAPPCDLGRMSAWLFCLTTPWPAGVGRAV